MFICVSVNIYIYICTYACICIQLYTFMYLFMFIVLFLLIVLQSSDAKCLLPNALNSLNNKSPTIRGRFEYASMYQQLE